MIQNPDEKEKVKIVYFIKIETSAWIKTNSQMNLIKTKTSDKQKNIFSSHSVNKKGSQKNKKKKALTK